MGHLFVLREMHGELGTALAHGTQGIDIPEHVGKRNVGGDHSGVAALVHVADLPPARVAVSNMALDHQGRLAFALAGVVCMTNLESLQAVPKIHQFA